MILLGEIVLIAFVGFFPVYLMLLSIFALFAKRERSFEASRLRRFAIIIPAHNEELTIRKTLKSVFSVSYPEKYFEVVVVADNCTDRTAEIARRCGAYVLERFDANQKGKGQALRWAFKRLLDPGFGYDAFVVIDADSTVSKNFLQVMNSYLEQRAQVIQAADLVQPQPGVWSPEVTRVGFLLYNYVRPLGRKVIGCSAGLRGNGMCFSTEVLQTVPWNANSLTEDLEYGLILLLNDIPVVFAPEAAVYATMPCESQNAITQRVRWEGGRMQIIQKYVRLLIAAAAQRRSFRALDALIDLVTPPVVNLLLLVGLITFAHIAAVVAGVDIMQPFMIAWALVLFAGILHVVVGLLAAGADRSFYRALWHVPRYALWKARVYGKILRKGKPQEWVRTTREKQKRVTT